MRLRELIEILKLCPIHIADPEVEVLTAYCGDLLSDVLANVPGDAAWFTIQGHINAIAVAQLRDVACVVLVNGTAPDPQTVAKAASQGINVCGSDESSAALCMKLAGVLRDAS